MGQPIDYDDPAVDEEWCTAARAEVTSYLAIEGVDHGEVGQRPAWHVAPVVSVWAIESRARPGHVGWWVLYGDLPTDYVSGAEIDHPREAIRSIAQRWQAHSTTKKFGGAIADTHYGDGPLSEELAPLLQSRARTLSNWADDDKFWNEDCSDT
jgi:hypothetical protein